MQARGLLPRARCWTRAWSGTGDGAGVLCGSEALRRAHPQGHALRAAINTPIQGSAADVATAAMLAIDRNARLRALGWRMLLQARPPRPCPSRQACSPALRPPWQTLAWRAAPLSRSKQTRRVRAPWSGGRAHTGRALALRPWLWGPGFAVSAG